MHLGWMYSPLMNISQARRPLGCPDVDNLKTKQAEESKGELVVQPEGGIVDQAFLEFHIFAKTSQEAQHCKSQSVVL